MRRGQVLAVRALLLEEVGHCVEPESVQSEVEPEAEGVDHRLPDLGVRVVEVGLMVVEPMPEVRTALGVVRPVRLLAVDEDDPRVLVAVHRVRPDVPVGLRVVGAPARLLEPRVLARGVVHDEVGDDAHPPLVRCLDECRELVERAELGRDREEVGDVVAAVAERRRVEGKEPDAVDAEPLQVVELLTETAEVADPVVGRVEERPRVELVEDRRPEPVRLRLEPVLAHGLAREAGVRRSGSPPLDPRLRRGRSLEAAASRPAVAAATPSLACALTCGSPPSRGPGPARGGRSCALPTRSRRP